MAKSRRINCLVPLIAGAMLVAPWCQTAHADQYFDYGMALLKQKKFAEAQRYFDQRLKVAPKDVNALYYKALCLHYTRDISGAKQIYAQICQESPNSKVAQLAMSALRRLDDGGPVNARRVPSNVRTGVVDSEAKPNYPEQERVYFTTSGADDIIVPVKINGRRIDMCFDTGAHSVYLGKNHLEQLGLQLPPNAPTTQTTGVGGTVDAHQMKANVALGNIVKPVLLTVADRWDGHPLLGQTFFGDMEYEFDHKANCIVFRHGKQKDVASDLYAVPFRRRGKHLIVDVQVSGGKKTSMIVDTGAESIALTETNLRELGLTIPDDAQQMRHVGVGGETPGYSFSVDEIRLGPIIQKNAPVSVMIGNEKFVGSEGLLGMSFFRNWRYTIDNENKCLRFFH